MRVIPTLTWSLDGDPAEALDDRLLPLLEVIAQSASLAAAVVTRGISYRSAWGLLRDYERKLGAPLVLLERGRGASLTAAGKRLVAARKAASLRLARVLPGLAIEFNPGPRREVPGRMQKLRIAASHDLALAALSEILPAEAGLRLELSFMGSLHALREYAEDHADVAGFHVPIKGCAALDRTPFLRWLHPRRDLVVRFVDRDQGLILPRGNPAKIATLRDLAAKGLRFVNRQRGSGTRLLIDQLMVDNAIDSSAINGFATEEFTHAAVAATVASGGAAAGFGLRAAAAEYQLAFVPLVRERYFLVVRAKIIHAAPTARFLAALRSPAFGRIARQFVGYQYAAAGTVVGLDALGFTGKA